jgi:hypothetical protein
MLLDESREEEWSVIRVEKHNSLAWKIELWGFGHTSRTFPAEINEDCIKEEFVVWTGFFPVT